MTKLVNGTLWLIEPDKLTKYLLNLSHGHGGPKAAYFLSFGFSADDPDALGAALADHGMAHLPGRLVTPMLGPPRIVFSGPIVTPDGRNPVILSVWDVSGQSNYRLLTAYPDP